jgi:hypothetical protein
MISGLQPLARADGGFRVLGVAAVALLLGSLVVLIGRRTRRPGPWLGAVALLVIGAAAINLHGQLPRRLSPPTVAALDELRELEVLEGYDQPIRVSLIPERFQPDVPLTVQRAHAYMYQWHLPDQELRLLYPGEVAPGTLVFGTTTDEYLQSTDATIIWTDPNVDMALWRVP